MVYRIYVEKKQGLTAEADVFLSEDAESFLSPVSCVVSVLVSFVSDPPHAVADKAMHITNIAATVFFFIIKLLSNLHITFLVPVSVWKNPIPQIHQKDHSAYPGYNTFCNHPDFFFPVGNTDL